MSLYVMLMSAGIKWILIILLILLLGGAVSYLLVKEKNRKDRAAQRAAERKAIRDKVLEEARSGNAQAFENLSVHKRPADQPVLSSEDSMRLAKLEKLENDLNALQNVGSTDSRRFSTTELNIAEASGEVVANAGADDLSVGIAALANGESNVNFRQLASQLDEVENKEAEIEAKAAPAAESAVKATAAEAEKQAEEVKSEVMAEAIAPLAAVVTESAEELDPEEEAAKKVIPFTDTEDDFEELVFAPVKEVPEEESDYKPYRDEYEDLADEAEKQAVLSGSHLGVPLPVMPKEEEPEAEQSVGVEDLYDEEEAKTIEEAPAAEGIIAGTAAAASIGAAVVAGNAQTMTEEPEAFAAEPAIIDEPAEPEVVPAEAVEEPSFNELVPEPVEEEPPLFDEKDYQDTTSIHTEPAKMYDTMGFTMSLEMQKLSDEERRAAREARMAEKAKYAAALAGEGDYMPEEEVEEEEEDEDLDLEDEEKISVGRVILWIFAAILSLVCVGAILYLMFGSFFHGGFSLGAIGVPAVFRVLRRMIR